MNKEEILQKMTLEEKVAMIAGADFWTTVPNERVGVPTLKVTDGPNGARGEKIRGGTPGVCYPCGSALASTWNSDLLREIGESLSAQVKSKGAHVLLAPTVNIHRTPIAGRNFECYSEDPYLTAQMAINYITGLQSNGVGACIKHYVANDQEFERSSISAEVDERTLHEIYLEPFRLAVRDAKPWAIMSSYNRVNGTYCSEDKALLIDLLKEEWGFDGVVVSDWFGSYSDNAAEGGLDLEMPGTARWMGENVVKMVQEGDLDEAVIDDKVSRLLTLLDRTGATDSIAPEDTLDTPEDRALVRRAGGEAIVLLKNDNDVLPLDDSKTIAVIGANAMYTQYQGGGSAHVTVPYIVSPLDGIKNGSAAEVAYSLGCTTHKRLPLIEEVEFTMDYYNDPDGDIVHSNTTHSTQIAWFGDLPKGVEEGFSLKVKGTFVAKTAGSYQFSLVGVGESQLWLDDKLIIDNSVDPSSVNSPFEMWESEKIATVELREGQEAVISMQYTSVRGVPWRAVRIGHLPPISSDPIAEAVQLAKTADVVVIVVGLNDEWESEGFDRIDMNLPGDQDELIRRVAEVNPNTVVVLNVGSAVHMPWVDDVAAVLQGWYLGQEQGNAIADVLFGRVNPSAKLPTTFPVRYEDNPAYINYPGENGKVRYGEGLFVGYRYYDKKKVAPLFPFGHGLSYTEFVYDNLAVTPQDSGFSISVDVTNTGGRDGSEVVQCYVRDVECTLVRPEKELKAFTKVALSAGETKTVSLSLTEDAFHFYQPMQQAWVSEAGEFEILIGASSADIRLSETVMREVSSGSFDLHIGLPLGVIMDDPRGLQVISEKIPEILQNNMLDMAKGMPLTQIANFAPDQLTAEVLADINAALKEVA